MVEEKERDKENRKSITLIISKRPSPGQSGTIHYGKVNSEREIRDKKKPPNP